MRLDVEQHKRAGRSPERRFVLVSPCWCQRPTKPEEVSVDVERAPFFASAVATNRCDPPSSIMVPAVKDHSKAVGIIGEASSKEFVAPLITT